MARGRSKKAIGVALHVGEGTVKTHVASIPAQAAGVFAQRGGSTSDPPRHGAPAVAPRRGCSRQQPQTSAER
jgi:hypothetical protein